jgi:hypothetical protein
VLTALAAIPGLQRLGGRADENGSILQHWKDTTWE